MPLPSNGGREIASCALKIETKTGSIVQPRLKRRLHNIFKSSSPDITTKVRESTNRSLILDPSEEEIKVTLFYINPDKAPGPDGMTSILYQRFMASHKPRHNKASKGFFATGSFDQDLIK